MGSADEEKKQNEKKSVEFTDLGLQQAIPKLIHQSLQGVREDIQIIQKSHKDLQKSNEGLDLMIRGIYAEIQDIKKVTKGISHRIDRFFDMGVIKKTPKPHIKEISTGLDLLTQIPHHLRDTFQTLWKRDRGASASEVSRETGKSRSLESDYLNQLVDRGFVSKRRQGKKVLFFKIGEIEEEEEEEEEEDTKDSNDNGSLDFIVEKQREVNNSTNSHNKHTIHIKSYKK